MKKIISLNLSRDHYVARGTILWCFDDRFTEALEKFKASMPGARFDDVRMASGGLKKLASPEKESDQKEILEEISKSVRLHQSHTIFIMAHNECGDYGGITDRDFYLNELAKAERVIQENFSVKIVKLFVDFDGIYEV